MSKLKILCVGDIWWPLTVNTPSGGVEKFVSDCSRLFNSDEFEIDILGPSDSENLPNFISWGINSKCDLLETEKEVRYNYRKICEVIKTLPKYDVIINNMNNQTVLEGLCKTGSLILHMTHLVMNYQGVDLYYKKIRSFKEKYSNLKIVSVSNFVHERLNTLFENVSDYILSPNYNESPESLNPNPSDYFVSVGRICKDKNSYFLMKLFEDFDENLLMIGPEINVSDSEKKYLNDYVYPIKEKNKNINFLGLMENSLVLEYIKNAKALVHACTDEAYPLVVLEAQKLGVPVIYLIGKRKSGISEIVIEGTTGDGYQSSRTSIGNNVEGMRKLIKNVNKYDRNFIYKIFREKYSKENFINNFKRITNENINNQRLLETNS